jgi:hypothetical protein
MRTITIAVVLALLAPVARGDDAGATKPAATTPAPATKSTAVPAPANPTRPAHRSVPDYDGRAPEPTTTGDVLLWIPRALLFPVRIVIDYGVRRPFGYVVHKAEHSRGFRRFLARVFRHVEDANPLIFPVVLADFGLFKSSVGLRVLYRRGYLIPKSDVSLRVGTGGLDWWRADIGTKTKVGALRATTEVGINQRPDYVFYGIGRDTPETARARYAARKVFARGSIGGHVQEVGETLFSVGITDTDLESSTYSGDASIDEQIAAGGIEPLRGGYERDYRTARVGARVTLDTRFDGKRARSGARLDAEIEYVRDLDASGSWTRVELMAGGGLLLDRVAERKLDVHVAVELVEPDRDSTVIPFPELATISGTRWLKGLPTGRVYDRSAAAFIVDYHWPLAAWLDAHAHVGAGNVFDAHLRGFALRHLRGSFGGALTIAGLTDRLIGVSLAFGTEPLGDGVDINSVRFILEYSSDY